MLRKTLYLSMVALLSWSAATAQIHKMQRKDTLINGQSVAAHSSAIHRTYNPSD